MARNLLLAIYPWRLWFPISGLSRLCCWPLVPTSRFFSVLNCSYSICEWCVCVSVFFNLCFPSLKCWDLGGVLFRKPSLANVHDHSLLLLLTHCLHFLPLGICLLCARLCVKCLICKIKSFKILILYVVATNLRYFM